MSDGAAASRAVVGRYFAASNGQGDLADVFHPDVRWDLPQTNPMGTPIVGRDAVLAMLGSGIDLFDPSSMQTEIHTMVADADHVAVRLTFRTRTAAGTDYRNEYLLLFAIRDDRITEVWEQPDTLYQEQMGVFASYR